MNDERREKLINLGAEKLADSFLGLAFCFKDVEKLVDSMIASPEENIKKFKNKLAGLKRSRKFIDYWQVDEFSDELRLLLLNLRSWLEDPCKGMELVAAFYQVDQKVLSRCDDSNGIIGDVFLFDAADLFIEYASRCQEKEKAADLILKLNLINDNEARRVLVDRAGELLPEDMIRSMIRKFQKQADKESDEYAKINFLSNIGSLARQIGDIEIYKKAKFDKYADQDELPVTSSMDIVEVYLEIGDAESALSWIKKLPENKVYTNYTKEKNQLLIKIYQKLGDTEKQIEILYEEFRSHYSIENLQALLNVIGLEKRDEVIQEALADIRSDTDFDRVNVNFLIDLEMVDEAENYILKRSDQIEGQYYSDWLPLAKVMEKSNRLMTASLIYRSLLSSILKKANTKAYTHAAKYLAKLDQFAESITDWGRFKDHKTFTDDIIRDHWRKKSFWSKYE